MSNNAWRGRARGLVLVGVASAALGCAPPCYDDGALQGGGNCPVEGETDSATGPTTGSTSSTQASGTGDSGVMTAEGTGSESVDTSGGVSCPGHAELLAPPTRTFQLVVEQSGNMSLDLDGVSRYDAIAEVLFDPMTGVVATQDDTRFGMMVYRGLQAGCPMIESEPPQAMAAAPLAALMANNPPSGSNPVPDTVDEAVVELMGDMATGDKTLVLLLGNEPGSCDIQNPVDAIQLGTTRQATTQAVTDAQAAGFPAVVVSVGGDVDAAFLQQVANAGAGQQPGDPDAPFWEAADRAELLAALEQITATDRPCSFPIDEAIPAELAPACVLTINGAELPFGDPDGWDLPDPQTLELSGAACDSIQNGLIALDLTCDCDA